MQTDDDTNQNNFDEADSINDYDDSELFNEEADLPFVDDFDEACDDAARGKYDEPIENQDDESISNLHMIDAESGDGVQAKSTISDLPITVTAQIGTFSMSLSDLDSLNQGDLIKVPSDYQEKVSLQVSGAEIGVGEIVSINGKVAIQITRLWS